MESITETLTRLSDELAVAISRRDADAAACGVREDEHVAYVSDGNVIRGRDYRDVLRRFYDGVRELDFRWDSREIESLEPLGGVVIGFATISIVDHVGVNSTSKAVFTLVYKTVGDAWELVTAHKTTIR